MWSHRRMVLGVLLAVLVGAAPACDAGNSPPSLGLILDQQVSVGDSLRLVLTASDPDGDRINFEARGLPEGALVTPRSLEEAVLSWSPTITDTEPGGRRYDVVIEASDGRGGVARQAFGLIVFPTFGVPTFDLPSGVVINLAQDDDLSLLVEVKDDDSTDVTITMTEGPDQSRLQKAGAKTAFFHWRPTDAQREISVHRAVLTAQDESHAPVTHVLTLVLLNAEQGAGCQGSPPVVTHLAPADHSPSAPRLELHFTIADADSQIRSATLNWTAGDPEGSYTALPLTRAAPESPDWRGTIELPSIPGNGQLVHYTVTATDNDDPTGVACDQTSVSPKTGFYTAAIYPPGTPNGVCADDPNESDNSVSNAVRRKAGTWAGYRMCGADIDLVAIDAPPETTVTASVVWPPTQGLLELRLIDASGVALSTDYDAGDGELQVQADVVDDTQLYAEISSNSPMTRLSYTVDISVNDVACSADANEPDSSPSEATPVGLGTYEDLQLCPGDSDFFRIDMSAGQSLRFSLDFDHRYGDLDLELRDSDGVTVLGLAASERSLEELVHSASANQTVFLRVFGVGAARNAYRLIVAQASQGAACTSDGLGDNHTPESATTLFQGVYEGFYACSGAPDWFSVDLNGGETFAVLATAPPGQPLDISIFVDPEAPPVASGTVDGTGSVLAEYIEESGGRLYYRVDTSADEVEYNLLQDVADPPGSCQPDRFEPNSAQDPTRLDRAGVFTWLRMCGDADIDAFTVELGLFQTVTVLTGHDTASGGFTDLELIGPRGDTLSAATDYGAGGFLEVLAEEPGEYTVVVKPFNAGANLPYDLAILRN